MFLKDSFGQHSIYSYDTEKYKLREYFEKIFYTSGLENLHKINNEFYSKEGISDIETDFHKIFYKNIKSDNEFKNIYCSLIKEIHRKFFSDNEYLIYQSFPSVRFQFINNVAVPPHCDSDDIGKHPLGEKNFLLPITSMYGSKRLFIESEPGLQDFKGIDLNYGELFYFNGNKCIHYNEKNIENEIRISLDFRIILPTDYLNYINSGKITQTNPRDPEKQRKATKMLIGGYYQITNINDNIEKMMKWYNINQKIMQSRPVFGIEEADACHKYIMNDGFITEHKITEKFEKELCNYINSKHCILTTSGNSAIILALLSLDIGVGDEVIVPDYTMIATVNSVKMVGATPIFVDVCKNTFTIGLDAIKTKITSKTKAIIHVSLNNRQDSLKELSIFCKTENIFLIEDAAQSLGCFLEDKHLGTYGDIGCFSLSTPKIISTGQGGFIVTDNDEINSKIRMIKNFGRKESGSDVFDTFGINLKFTDLQSIIGLEQLKKLPDRVSRLKKVYSLYYEYLKDSCNILESPNQQWIPWFVDIVVKDRHDLSNFLSIHNVETRNTYPQVSKTIVYNDLTSFPNSENISSNGLFLPTHMCLTNEDIEFICILINFFLRLKNLIKS